MAYSVHWEPPAGVWLQLSGVVSAAEFVAAVREVHSHHHYDSLRYVIDDLTGLDRFDVDQVTVYKVFAESVGAGMVNPNRRIYVVTSDDTVISYLRQVAEKYGGALPITRFSTLEQAREAIRLDGANQRLFVR